MSIRAADMPGADDLMMRIYAAMAQKERELISERTRVALAAAKARGKALGGIAATGRQAARMPLLRPWRGVTLPVSLLIAWRWRWNGCVGRASPRGR